MLDLKNLPQLQACAVIDYANSRVIPPQLSCTRASAAITKSVAEFQTNMQNVPRLAYLDDKCCGLLTEGAYNNLNTNSKLSVGTEWIGPNVTVVYDQESFIPGARAVKITVNETTNATAKGIRQYITHLTAGVRYCVSYFLKPNFDAAGKFVIRLRSAQWIEGKEVYQGEYRCKFTPEISGHNGCEYYGDGVYRAWYSFVLSENIQRLDLGFWFGDAKEVFQIANGGYELLMSAPQIETGSFPRSPLITLPGQTASAPQERNIIDVGDLISPEGFTVACVATTSAEGEYIVQFGSDANEIGEFIGVRMNSTGGYINSSEGARSYTVERPAFNKRSVVVMSLSNNGCFGMLSGKKLNANDAVTGKVDFSKRRFMKHNVTGKDTAGKSITEQVFIWNRPLSEQEVEAIYKVLE